MEAAYVSALFGLGGAAIGAMASFLTTWMTQKFQFNARLREADRAIRTALFDDFITEAVRLYADALTHQRTGVDDLVKLYALVARMKLTASQATVDAAEQVIRRVIEAYLAPNLDLAQIYGMAKQGQVDILVEFGQACRTDLRDLMGASS